MAGVPNALAAILGRLQDKLDWNKNSWWSLGERAESIQQQLISKVKNDQDARLPTTIKGNIDKLMDTLSEVDVFVLKYPTLPLAKRVWHLGRHRDLLAQLELRLVLAFEELTTEQNGRIARKNNKILQDITATINDIKNIKTELQSLRSLVDNGLDAEVVDEPRQLIIEIGKQLRKCEELAKDSVETTDETERTYVEFLRGPTALKQYMEIKFGRLGYDKTGTFGGCIHCSEENPEMLLRTNICKTCRTNMQNQKQSRARWQTGFRGFELVFVVASAVMMLSWVWPRLHEVHKMQPWANRHDKELWLSISAGLATFFALLSFGKQVMSPIGDYADLGQTKLLYAVLWAVGDLLTAISGMVTIVLIFQHKLFELDLGEPDSTGFISLSCMYGLDVVYQLVFLGFICLGCCACCTGHSNNAYTLLNQEDREDLARMHPTK